MKDYHEPDVVIKSFIELAENNENFISNQFIIDKKLLPAILNCQEFPAIPFDKVRYAAELVYALTRLLRDSGNWKLSPKVFAFGHSIGHLNKVVSTFAGH